MEPVEVVQGDSIERDITNPTITDFTGWGGKWAIMLKDAPFTELHSDVLTVSTDLKRLECRVPPYDDTDVLPVGKVTLEIQVSNAALKFRRTISQEIIKIIQQRIKP